MFEATPVDPSAVAFDEQRVEVIEGWSIPAVAIGVTLIATAVSGLLNELPATEHPLWIVPAIAVFAACLAVAARSIRSVMSSAT